VNFLYPLYDVTSTQPITEARYFILYIFTYFCVIPPSLIISDSFAAKPVININKLVLTWMRKDYRKDESKEKKHL